MIEETLATFRANSNLRQYIPLKSNSNGLKILDFCDAKIFYTFTSNYTAQHNPRDHIRFRINLNMSFFDYVQVYHQEK